MPAVSSLIAGAAIVGAGALAAGTAYQIKSSMDAASDAEDAADSQRDQTNQALQQQKELDEKGSAQRSSAAAASAQLARSRRLRAGTGGGRSGTILTSPIVASSIGGTSMTGISGGGSNTILGS